MAFSNIASPDAILLILFEMLSDSSLMTLVGCFEFKLIYVCVSSGFLSIYFFILYLIIYYEQIQNWKNK